MGINKITNTVHYKSGRYNDVLLYLIQHTDYRLNFSLTNLINTKTLVGL